MSNASRVYSLYDDGVRPVYSSGNVDQLEQFIRREAGDQSFAIHLPMTSIRRPRGGGYGFRRRNRGTHKRKCRKRLSRDGAKQKGEIGVSCSYRGKKVPVQSINIDFRCYKDPLTDRGIVWVYPGEPAVASFTLNTKPFKAASESLRTIVEAAEKALHEKVLKHFPTDTPSLVS